MEAILFSPQAWLGALGIFALRVGDMSMDTMRMLFVVRGRKGLAWGLGFVQSLIYIVAISTVLANLNNPLNIVGYAAGFATGNVIGMLIEERLAIGHIHFRIISSNLGKSLAEKLRESGYAVTEFPARGKNGTVTVLECNVLRRGRESLETIVKETDPDAFVTAEDVRPVRHGYWRA
jgi:uncharacterized protein YebE (UPF0316 family)